MPGIDLVSTVSAVEQARRRREAARTVATEGRTPGPEGPREVGAAIDAVISQPTADRPSLRERILRRIGWGDNRAKRQVFLDRVCRLHAQHEGEVEALISEAWCEAQSAHTHRDRLFVKSLALKIRESGLLDEGRPAAYEPI